MGDLKTSVVIDLAGNLTRKAKQYTQSMGNFSAKGQRYLKQLSTVAGTTGRLLDRAGNRYTALLTGAAGVGTGKQLVSLQRRFTRLGIQSNKSADDMARLKKEIHDVASAPDIRVDPSEITSAIEQIVEKTGDLDFARKNIRNIGLALQATGAEGGAIGGIMAEFQKMGIVLDKDVLTALDTLNMQGKEGAFTLQNLAALGPRVVTAYTSMGRGGVLAIREMGAALQVIRQGTGSSEMAATAFEALMRTLGDADKVKMLQKGGIQVFDVEALKKGQQILRPVNELMVEIVKKTKGKKTVLSKVFDAEAIRAFNAASSEFIRTGKVESLQKFMNVNADGTTTMKDSARAAKDAAGALQNLYTAWKKFADESLTGPLQDAADLLHSLGSETTGKVIKGLVIGGAGALVAGKAYKYGSRLLGRGAAGAAGVGGGLLGGMPLPLPVYVVNKHMSLSPDAWSNAGGAGGKAGAASRLSRLGKFAKYAGPVGLAGAAGYGAGALINKSFIEGTAFQHGLGEVIARVLARFGNNNARLSIDINNKSAGQVRVRQLEASGMDLDVDTGLMSQ